MLSVRPVYVLSPLHIEPVVEQLRAEGQRCDDELLSLTTPLLRRHLNPFGRILSEMRPFDEELVHAKDKGRPKIVDAVWTLYPSTEFVSEIIDGNKEMKAYREAGGNKGESRLLLGFQERAGRGK